MIPELLIGTSPGFPRRVNKFCAVAQILRDPCLQRQHRRRHLKFLDLLAAAPFMSKMFDAIAIKGNPKTLSVIRPNDNEQRPRGDKGGAFDRRAPISLLISSLLKSLGSRLSRVISQSPWESPSRAFKASSS